MGRTSSKCINNRAFGRKIKIAREDLGLTQFELAEKIDVSQNFLGDIERGIKLPSLNKLIALSNTLSCSFYGQTAWKNLTNGKLIFIFNILVVIGIISVSKAGLGTVISIIDTFYLSLAIPNLIGVFMLSGLIKRKIIRYKKRLDAGIFDRNFKKDNK